MSNSFRCPECGSPNPVFTAMNESLLAIPGELALEPSLKKIADVARSLVHASYAGIGVGDGNGFSRFVASGMTDEQVTAVGPASDRHGMLWSIFSSGEPYRTSDLEQRSDFGGWPEHHPPMRSLLGVPIVSRDRTIGAFFIANQNTWGFSSDDEELIRMLATHAAIAIDNAALYEQSRDLSIVQERNRLARELHDSVNQMLFSIGLTTETSLALMDADSEGAKVQLKRISEIAKDAQREMRSLIFELRPVELEAEGLVSTLRKHVDVLRSLYPVEIELIYEDCAVPPGTEAQLFRILQEALNNAMKHSAARRVEVWVGETAEGVAACVRDDGVGFERSSATLDRGHLGLASMHERAALLGARLEVTSEPGRGTEMRVLLGGSDRR